MTQENTNNEKFYFEAGLKVLDLTVKEWQASNKLHTKEDLIDLGKGYEKGMGR